MRVGPTCADERPGFLLRHGAERLLEPASTHAASERRARAREDLSASLAKYARRAAVARRARSSVVNVLSGSTSRSKRPKNFARAALVVSRASRCACSA